MVVEELLMKVMKESNSRKEELSDWNVLYVTQLFQCPYKTYLEKTLGITKVPNYYLLFGRVVHEGLEKMLLEEDNGWTAEVPIKIPVKELLEEYPASFEDAIIKGRVDLYNEERDELVEIKTIKTVENLEEPIEHHVYQVVTYSFVLSPRVARIVYLSKDGFKSFEIDSRKLFELKKEVKEKILETLVALDELRRGKRDLIKMKRVESWQCFYCDFYQVCQYRKSN